MSGRGRVSGRAPRERPSGCAPRGRPMALGRHAAGPSCGTTHPGHQPSGPPHTQPVQPDPEHGAGQADGRVQQYVHRPGPQRCSQPDPCERQAASRPAVARGPASSAATARRWPCSARSPSSSRSTAIASPLPVPAQTCQHAPRPASSSGAALADALPSSAARPARHRRGRPSWTRPARPGAPLRSPRRPQLSGPERRIGRRAAPPPGRHTPPPPAVVPARGPPEPGGRGPPAPQRAAPAGRAAPRVRTSADLRGPAASSPAHAGALPAARAGRAAPHWTSSCTARSAVPAAAVDSASAGPPRRPRRRRPARQAAAGSQQLRKQAGTRSGDTAGSGAVPGPGGLG